MARYNEILVGRFARAVQKLFGMKGEVPIGSLAGELVVVHPFLNGMENRYLEGWDTFAIAQNIAAGGAGNRSAIRFLNPAGSNMLAVFVSIILGNTLADQPFISVAPGLGSFGTPVATTSSRLDARGRPQPTMLVSSSTAAGNAPSIDNFEVFLGANQAFQVITTDNQEIPLLPGDSLTILAQVLNQNLPVNVMWRERYIEEGERA